MKHIAIIGTAGRDKDKPMTAKLWDSMVAKAASLFKPDGEYHVYSGGAAWADHLAVWLYLGGNIQHLTLHLPAPLTEAGFAGGRGTAGSASAYYHRTFGTTIGQNTLRQLLHAKNKGATITEAPVAPGMGAFFARNALVAKDAVDGVLAFTWGAGKEVADGGTKHTWNLCQGRKLHIPLDSLEH